MSDKAVREDAIRNGLIDRWAAERRKMLEATVARHGLDPACVERELNVASNQLAPVTNEKLLNGEDASDVGSVEESSSTRGSRNRRR